MANKEASIRRKYIMGRAKRVGLEVEIEGSRYIFTNPENRQYTICDGLKEAEDFSTGLIWGNLETRP